MRTLARVVTTVAALAAVLTLTAAAQAAFTFSDPAALPKSLPSEGADQLQGGEPSLAFDPTGDGHVYSVAPGADGSLGVGFWGSADGGATWPLAKPIGSLVGGFDSDVDVGVDHTVYALDLEAASSAVCRSRDFGKTFDDGCESGAAQDQAGAEEDRQWLQHDPNDPKVVYFNYHDLALEYPVFEKSTDGGSSFFVCGQTIDPSAQPGLFPSAIENTIVGKPAVDKGGNIYIPVGAPTPTQVLASGSATPPYGQIVVAWHKGCSGGDQFNNTTVWSDDGASFSNLFISNTVGPDGTLYVIASGKLNAQDGFNTYLWISRDGAKTFSKPIRVNPPDQKTTVMSAVAAGTKPGQVALSWYGAQNVADPDDTKGVWHYYAAKSDDFGKTWQQAAIGANPFHYGDICTAGIACTTGNRNLFDFASIAVNPKTGRYMVVFPGDPFNTLDREANGDLDPAAAYFACEGGCGQGKPQVLGVRAGCRDTSAPVSAVSRKRSRFTRGGITLRGVTTDKGCGPRGRGQVARETLAISRRAGKKCQWLERSGRFSRAGSCRRKTYVRARGSSKWSYRLKRHLRPGVYAVSARGADAVGNVEKPRRRAIFKVR